MACCQDETEVLVTLTRAGRSYTQTLQVNCWDLHSESQNQNTPNHLNDRLDSLKDLGKNSHLAQSQFIWFCHLQSPSLREPLGSHGRLIKCHLNNTDLPLAPGRMASSALSLHVDKICQMYIIHDGSYSKNLAPYRALFNSSATIGRHRIKCT